MSVIPQQKSMYNRYLTSLCVLALPIAAIVIYRRLYNKPKLQMTNQKLLELLEEDVYTLLVKKIGHTSFEVLKFNLEAFEGKIGLLGDHMILHATVNIFSNGKEECDITFFAKFVPYSSETQLRFCIETGAFKKEVFVYELMNLIKESSNILDCVPQYYFSKKDHVLVTENMSDRNFKLVDKMKTLNYDVVAVILNSLAKLHVSTILYEERQTQLLGKKYRLIDNYEDNFEETFFNGKEGFINANGIKASLNGILSEIDIFNCPKTLNSGKNFKDVIQKEFFKIYELVKPNNSIRNVLCHGDLWGTNFLIKYDDNHPKDCVFVDFQQGRYAPPSHDLMSLLYLNTSRDFRMSHMYEIIGTYYAKMEKFLKSRNIDIKTIWSFDEFLGSCEEQKLFAILQTAVHFQLVLADDNYFKKIMNNAKLSWKILHEDRTPLIVKNLEMCEVYKHRLKESIQDLQDYCEYL